MILPCGHTICLRDLQQLAHHAEGTGLPPRCPSCKARFQYHRNHIHHAEQEEASSNSSSTGGVSRNFALQEIMETALRLTGGVPPNAIPRCAAHPLGLLELWCEDCGVGVCPRCFLERHRGHDMKGLDEAFQGRREREVAEALAVGERALQQAQVAAAGARDRRALLLAAHEGHKQEIGRHFALLLAAAQRRRAQLLAEADRVWSKEVEAPCEAEAAAAAARAADVGKRLQELRTLRGQGCFLALMDVAPRARKALEDACARPPRSSSSSSSSSALPSALELRWGDWPVERVVAEAIDAVGAIEVRRPPVEESAGEDGAAAIMEGGVEPCPPTARAGYVTARGSGLRDAVLGQTGSFLLTTYGPDGRRRLRGGGDDFVVTIQLQEQEGESGSGASVAVPTVRDLRDGTYEVTYDMPACLGWESFDEESLSGALPPAANPTAAALVTTSQTGGAAGLLGLGMATAAAAAAAAGSTEPRYLIVTITAHRRPNSRQLANRQPPDEHTDAAAATTPPQRPWRQESVAEEAIEDESGGGGLALVEKGGPATVVGGPAFHVRLHPAFVGVPIGTLGRKGALPGCLDGPGSLAVDGDLLWVADGDNHRVQVLDLGRGGALVAVYGGSSSSGGGGGGDGLAFRSPYGVALDTCHAYVAERDGGRVSVLDKRTGRLLRVFGQDARMCDPLAVAVNSALVGVTDSSNCRVVFLDKRTGHVARVLGPELPAEAGGGLLACPCDVVFDEGADEATVYISDREASRILVFDTRSWVFLRQIGSHGTGAGEFSHVNRLCVAHDRVYASDRFGRRVLAFNKHTGDAIAQFGAADPATGERLLDRPNGVTVWGSRVLCADYAQSRLHVFA